MTETTDTTDATDDAPTASQSPAGPNTPGPAADDEMGLLEQLQWGALILLTVAAVWTAAQFYRSTTRAIEIWVGTGYQPLVMAAFNLALLLGAVAGVARLARRLGSTPT